MSKLHGGQNKEADRNWNYQHEGRVMNPGT